jgi:hypothetical protein
VFVTWQTDVIAEAGYISAVLGHNVSVFHINVPVLIRPLGCVFQTVLLSRKLNFKQIYWL